ncbi:MAG: AraC family transcriptional regulator [Emcibacteraceae bacterium]|nr:AraC family transcriptional regulator [Emcibacteraceae bacterium]
MLPTQTTPLANKLIFESKDVNEVHSTIGKYFKKHEISFLDKNVNLHTKLHRTRINQLAINVLEYGGNVMVDPGKLDDFYLIHINIRGQCELSYDKGHLSIQKNNAVICTPHRAHRFWWKPNSQVLAIQIPKQRLEEHVRLVTGLPIREEIDFKLELDLNSNEMQALSGFINFMIDDAGNDHGLSHQKVTSEYFEHALLNSLLRLQPGSHQAAVLLNDNLTAPAYVRRAENHMLSNLHRSIQMSELAEVAGVTSRTLRTAFQQYRGTSLARYFLCLRLAELHTQLTSGRPGQTVTDIAFNLGFHHLSNFAAAYRRRYDESPVQTLKRNQ